MLRGRQAAQDTVFDSGYPGFVAQDGTVVGNADFTDNMLPALNDALRPTLLKEAGIDPATIQDAGMRQALDPIQHGPRANGVNIINPDTGEALDTKGADTLTKPVIIITQQGITGTASLSSALDELVPGWQSLSQTDWK